MAKAILKLDKMPENCSECVMSTIKYDLAKSIWVCAALEHKPNLDIPGKHLKHRRPDCPLKEVKE